MPGPSKKLKKTDISVNKKPLIAIVGRPNTGKSTLFNRIVGFNKAITSEFEGTTRDRIFHNCEFGKYDCLLVDTGGLEFDEKENIEENVQLQSRIAIDEADLIIFLVSSKDLLTSSDYEAAELLRKSGKNVLLIANKSENPSGNIDKVMELYGLGFGEPLQISALNNMGLEDLINTIEEKLSNLGFIPIKNQTNKNNDKIKITFAGKPNVGKSSLINAFFNEEKVIVSDISGTTRDAVDLEFQYNEQKYVLVDTPGIKKPGSRKLRLEKYSFLRSLTAIEKSDVVIMVIDYNEGVTAQDCHILEQILEAKTGLIIAVNKCDLMDNKEEDTSKMIRWLQNKLKFVLWAPVVFVSALKRKNINKILDLAAEIKEKRNMRIKTADFNDFVTEAVTKHQPSGAKQKRPKLMYATQVDINPPHFLFFVNSPELFHFSYKRYLENRIREEYGFDGTCIKIDYRGRKVDEGRKDRRK